MSLHRLDCLALQADNADDEYLHSTIEQISGFQFVFRNLEVHKYFSVWNAYPVSKED